MRSVTLYTRPGGCHLCETMRAQLDAAAKEQPFTLEVLDIDADPELRARYDWDVPVLFIDGELVAKYRIDDATLRARLGSHG